MLRSLMGLDGSEARFAEAVGDETHKVIARHANVTTFFSTSAS